MKLRRSLALMVALGGLAGTTMTGSMLLAQPPKKEEKKEEKKPADDKKKSEAKAAGKIVIYEAKNGGWRYRIENGEEKTIAMATKSYETKEDLLKVLDEVKSILNTQKPVEGKAKE